MSTVDEFNVKRIRDKEPFKINLDLDIDYWLLLSVIALVGIGLMMVYSTTFVTTDNGVPVPTMFLSAQWESVLIGTVFMGLALVIDYRSYRKFSVLILGLTILALLLLFPFGSLVNGARRGFAGGGFQPAEVAKLALIMYISHWLSSKGDRINNFMQGIAPFSVIVGIVFALIASQPDVSTSAVIALISLTVFIVAGAAIRHILAGFAVSAVAAYIVLFLLPFSHIQTRLTDFVRGINSPSEAHFQVRQGYQALASGGWFGRGIGQSVQKFDQLPTPHTDSIFAVIGEELGFVGAMVVIGLLMLLVYRATTIAKSAKDEYGALLATGIASWFMFQTIINLAVVVGLAPTTGMVLPFISYGGSSMVMMLIAVGVLLNISRDGRRTDRIMRRQQTT